MYLEIETNPHVPTAAMTAAAAKGNSRSKLSVKVPSFFRCPISLDVMNSPVSLCTGVTYDRSSIQRWLDSGHATCPATMLPLPSTDLTPNLTLHRLIRLWAPPPPSAGPHTLLRDIRSSSANPLPAIDRLSSFLADESVDVSQKSSLVGVLADELIDPSSSIQTREAILRAIEKTVTVFPAMLSSSTVSSSLIHILKEGQSADSRRAAANVLHVLIRNVEESKVTMAENTHLLTELIRAVSDGSAVEAALSCLLALSEVRRARVRMVSLGIVSVSTTRVILEGDAGAAEKALRLLEAASGCADGREEICELGEECVGVILGRMMKVGKGGMESAVAVLWRVCHLYRDRRAQEAVAAANGGLTKMLLLMQSDCSSATRQMTGDLIKIFRVNSKSCLSGYDTKTTHITPF